MDENRDLQAEVDQLRRRLDELESEQQRTKSLIEQFQEGAISRRTFLAAVGGAAGIGALASNARAAPSWGSATGQLGTQSEPLNKVISQDIRAQTAELEQIDIGTSDFVASGDFVPLITLTRSARNRFSTSGSSFTGSGDYVSELINWSAVVPSNAQISAFIAGFSGGTVDADMDLRLRNTDQSETIVGPVTVSSGQTFAEWSSGPVNYVPSTRNSLDRIQGEIRSDGTNTVENQEFIAVLGLQL